MVMILGWRDYYGLDYIIVYTVLALFLTVMAVAKLFVIPALLTLGMVAFLGVSPREPEEIVRLRREASLNTVLIGRRFTFWYSVIAIAMFFVLAAGMVGLSPVIAEYGVRHGGQDRYMLAITPEEQRLIPWFRLLAVPPIVLAAVTLVDTALMVKAVGRVESLGNLEVMEDLSFTILIRMLALGFAALLSYIAILIAVNAEVVNGLVYTTLNVKLSIIDELVMNIIAATTIAYVVAYPIILIKTKRRWIELEKQNVVATTESVTP